jgi:predicted MPP superfamily phosphohydrolase
MPQTKLILQRIFNPFVIIFTLISCGLYSYAAIRVTDHSWVQGMVAIPFFLVWVVPVVYWHGQRESRKLGRIDHLVHLGCYLSMGWINFLLILLLLRDLILMALGGLSLPDSAGDTVAPLAALAPWYAILDQRGGELVLALSILAWILGTLKATQGPVLKEVDIEVPNLPPALHHFRIVQISDLHVGPTIRRSYVERVVAQTNSLQADMIALTGDMVDGSVRDLAFHAEPLKNLRSKLGSYMCLGNHDYYSGSQAWTQFWTEQMGILVLRNEHVICGLGGQSSLMVAGVTDPASRLEGPGQEPDPKRARSTHYQGAGVLSASGGPTKPADIGKAEMLRLMLAHNPKLASGVAEAGFDIQLSGHTHAGQFLPWTWATKLIHAPHYAGLSKEGEKLQVYVNAGTGSWGPPLRFGSTTELTLLKLVPA